MRKQRPDWHFGSQNHHFLRRAKTKLSSHFVTGALNVSELDRHVPYYLESNIAE
jgi:hypothetical protein